MILIRLLLILAICAGSAWGKPAPKAWMKYQIWNYGGSTSWSLTGSNGVTLRRFIAEHYAMSVGTPATGTVNLRIDSLQAINSEMEFYYYDQIYLAASDTVHVKAWATSRGYSSDSMFIRASDTIICRVTGSAGEGFEWWRTSAPGDIVIYSGYTDAQTRFAWDFRNPHIGEYLAHRYDSVADVYGIEGVMIDEECPTYRTGIGSGIRPRVYPFADNTATYHQRGYNAITRPFNTGALTHAQIMDSLSKLKWNTYDSMGVYLAAASKVPLPNWAGYGSPWNTLNNWNTEVRRASVKAKGMVSGEYCVFNPSQNPSGSLPDNARGNDYDLYLSNNMNACYGIRDSGVVMSVSWIKTGYTDVSAGNEVTLARSHMNFLGTCLAMEFSGTSQYFFAPCDNNGQVYYNNSHSALGETTHSDTSSFWAEAWGKYLGEPTKNVRDTAQTGTDGAGQTYKVIKLARTKYGLPDDTLIFAAGRFPRTNGAINDIKLSTTSVSVSLPSSKTWYQLNSDGTWTGPVTSTSIGNGEWEIFSSDTALSNVGPSITPSPSLLVDSVHNDAIGELDTLRTRTTASASMTAGDSLIVVYSLVSFAACDSSSGANSIRRSVPTAGVQYTDTFVLTNSETYTLYCAAWHWNATTGWSTRVQTSRTYTAAAPPPVASGQLIKWIRKQ